MNCSVSLSTAAPLDGNAFLKSLAADLHNRLTRASAEVAHLKMTLSPDEGNDLAVVNLVRTDFRPELSHSLAEPLMAGELLVNLRAEADPEFLRDATVSALEAVASTPSTRAKTSIDAMTVKTYACFCWHNCAALLFPYFFKYFSVKV